MATSTTSTHITHKVQTKLAFPQGFAKIHRKDSEDSKEGTQSHKTMQPQEEGFGETRRKHLCQSGKLPTRKRALVKPEGSTYAGARSDHRIPKRQGLNKV